MPRNSNKRWLWLVLTVTVGITLWTAINDQDQQALSVPPTRMAAPAAQPARMLTGAGQAASHMPPGIAHRAQITRQPLPLFSSQAAQAEQQAAESHIAVEEMPALPFTYAGKLLDGGRYTVFVLSGERSLAAHVGDVLEQVWRVKAIQPPAMTLVYLPLKKHAVMDIGSAMNLGESN